MSYNKHVKEELSGSVAKSYVAQITRFHRIQGSEMFHEAAEYVKNESLKLGLNDVTIEQYLADGKNKYWTHVSPVGWEAKSAELRLIEPEEKLLCTYDDIPQSLHVFSKSTPPEGVTAELVDVGVGLKPKDYEGKDVKGKFVLATGRARPVHEQAVYKHGALGVITDSVSVEMPNVRESLDVPDAHAYQAIWPTAEDLPKVAFGFSLSKRQGNTLRDILRSGKKVKLTAKIDAKLSMGNEYLVTATIKGSTKPNEEIFLVAHLCHPKPSANDNASGAGLLLEIARTIQTLIETGQTLRPDRTIRFFWVPETLGTVAYLSRHKDASNQLVAGINLDMIGQNQELCKSTLNLDRTPDSLPSFLNDYVYSLMKQCVDEFDPKTHFGSGSTFRYRTTPFSGGSDHAEFSDSTTGVPCVMLLQWPDLFYHTSMDTLDKVSEDSLKRVGWITTVAALTLANATHETILMLAYLTASKGMARIVDAGNQAVTELFKKTESLKSKDRASVAVELAKSAAYHRGRLLHVIWREQEAVRSVKRLGEHPELSAFIDRYSAELGDLGRKETARFEEAFNFIAKSSAITVPATAEETNAEKELRKLVPKRLFKGSLDSVAFKKALGEKEYEWHEEIEEKDVDFGKKTLEIANFMDGKRTGCDILNAISAEYSPTEPEHLLRYLQDLEKAKLITFQ